MLSMAMHPIQAAGQAVGAAGGDPRPMQLSSLFQSANEGPAKIAAKITGVNQGGKRADDGPYFTNNEGIPFPDPAQSKTVGGLPLVSDTFLLQKQQHFNRSKNLERMVHPCKYIVEAHDRISNPSIRWKWGLWLFRDYKGYVVPDEDDTNPDHPLNRGSIMLRRISSATLASRHPSSSAFPPSHWAGNSLTLPATLEGLRSSSTRERATTILSD